MRTRFDDWPVVTLLAEGEAPDVVRDAVLDLLHSALERGQPFAAVLDLTATAGAKEADRGPRTAEHARAVEELRPPLASWCRGLVGELGGALNGRQLRTRACEIMDANGLRRVRLYDARASCLTYLANKGVPDHLLARWAGHTNVKTTKKWYVKPDVADLLPAAGAWGGLAGGV